MTTHTRRLLVCLITAALVLSGLVVRGGPATAVDACTASSTPAASGQSAARRPTIVVHGWNGNAGSMRGTAAVLERQTDHRITPYLFDYGKNADSWAAAPSVSGCLATYIAAVSAAHRAVRGDGRVLIVAHSMGGLAALYAAAQGDTASKIGGVVTFDTPYAGSPFGGTLPAWALEFWQQRWGVNVPPAGSDAQVCLGTHDAGAPLPARCAHPLPPYLPPAIPLTQIAGAISVRRTFLGIHMYDLDFNADGIVFVPSSHGYLTAGPTTPRPVGVSVDNFTDACSITSDAVTGAVRNAGWKGALLGRFNRGWLSLLSDNNTLDGLVGDHLTPGLIAYLGAISLSAPCSHSNVVNDQSALNQATEALKGYLDRLDPLRAESLLSAPVPAACHHAPGRLVNGHQPDIPINDGAMMLSWADDPSRRANDLVFGDLTGDGVTDAATVLVCNAGGVGWPDILAFYGPGPTLLGSISLNDVTLPGNEAGENARVVRLQYNQGRVEASWATQQHGDPGALASIDYNATFGPANDGALAVSDIRATNEVPTAAEFASLLGSGDKAGAEQIAAADVVAEAAPVFDAHRGAIGATPTCYGIIDLDLPVSVEPFVAAGGSNELGGDRICLLTVDGSIGDTFIVLGMFRTGFNTWKVGWVRAV